MPFGYNPPPQFHPPQAMQPGQPVQNGQGYWTMPGSPNGVAAMGTPWWAAQNPYQTLASRFQGTPYADTMQQLSSLLGHNPFGGSPEGGSFSSGNPQIPSVPEGGAVPPTMPAMPANAAPAMAQQDPNAMSYYGYANPSGYYRGF